MTKAGLNTGKSGDPHVYGNTDKIKWGVGACDKAGAHLLEYPVFWEGQKTNWEKNEYTALQGKTPIRVVYANANGAAVYCGVMTHAKVTKEFKGEDYFVKCE